MANVEDCNFGLGSAQVINNRESSFYRYSSNVLPMSSSEILRPTVDPLEIQNPIARNQSGEADIELGEIKRTKSNVLANAIVGATGVEFPEISDEWSWCFVIYFLVCLAGSVTSFVFINATDCQPSATLFDLSYGFTDDLGKSPGPVDTLFNRNGEDL